MRLGWRAAMAALPLIILPLTTAAPASAATDSCIPGGVGPTCTTWTGKVTSVLDGDTYAVDVYGDGTSTPVRIRVTGVNAMEQSVYSSDPAKRRGECHALAATARAEQLIAQAGGTVRLAAQDVNSASGSRIRRSVAVLIDGTWHDLGATLLREGHGLWLANPVEYAWNARYQQDAAVARDGGTNLWDTDSCGYGPNQGSKLELFVNWDADGTDGRDLNGEWVQIKNRNKYIDVSLAGWWFRDSHLRRYTFPAGTVVPAGKSITLYMGSGTNTATRYYWGQTESVFDNVTTDATAIGDGGYLFDPQGDLRYWQTYPCIGTCTDALKGKVAIVPQPVGEEYVDIRNISTETINLEDRLLVNPPYIYAFRAATRLAAGQRLRVYVGSGTSTSLTRYWNKSSPILNNTGDVVYLRTHDDIRIACAAWGNVHC